jgi:hypothetical protein
MRTVHKVLALSFCLVVIAGHWGLKGQCLEFDLHGIAVHLTDAFTYGVLENVLVLNRENRS